MLNDRQRRVRFLVWGSGGAVAPTISSSAPANPVYGVAYSHQYTATGTTPITWSVTAGALPTGLSLDANTGVLSGTPTESGVFSFTVTATNAVGTGTQNATLTVAINTLMRDRYTTDRAAGAINGTAAEPGPGNRTTADPNSRLTISGGKHVGVAGGAGTFNTYTRYGPFTLVQPQAFVARISATTNRLDITAGSGTTSNQTPRIEVGSPISMRGINTGAVSTPHVLSLPQSGAIVRDQSGRVALFWNDRLYWIDEATDTAAWYGFTGVPTTTANGDTDDFQVLGLPNTYNNLYSLASVNVASPAASTNYTATANQVVRLTVTAPGVLANSAGLIFRGNATDGWRAYFDSAGAFKVARIVAGVEQAASVNVAGVIAVGATVTISLIMDGNLINALTIASGAPTNRGTQINNSHQAASTNLMVEIGAGWAVSNLRSWQVDNAQYATDLAFPA